MPIAHGLPKVTHADAQLRAMEDPLHLGGAFTFALAISASPYRRDARRPRVSRRINGGPEVRLHHKEIDPMKLHSKLKPAAALAALVMFTAYANSVFADDATLGYAPPVETHVAAPKDPAKAQRKADKKAARAADRHLAAAVRKALVKAGGVDASHISVLAKSGAITLAGSVPEAAQIERAQQQASQVAGVSGVTNRLTLATAGH